MGSDDSSLKLFLQYIHIGEWLMKLLFSFSFFKKAKRELFF